MRPLPRLNVCSPATSATSTEKGAETPVIGGRSRLRSVATSLRPHPSGRALDTPGRSRAAAGRSTLRPLETSDHAGFREQVAKVAGHGVSEFPLDAAGDPCGPCLTCLGLAFHHPPGENWRCSGCNPSRLPRRAGALAGWAFCSLPPHDEARLLVASRRALMGVAAVSDEGELLAADALAGCDSLPTPDNWAQRIAVTKAIGPAECRSPMERDYTILPEDH